MTIFIPVKSLLHTTLCLAILLLLSVSCEKPTVTETVIYTVTFDSRGGSTVKAIPIAKGKTVKKPDNPTKKDSLFAGWYTDNALTKSFNFNTAITANITLYAKWGTPVTVTFESNGGTAVGAITIAKGKTIKKPDNPTKQGSLFADWYSDPALTRVFDFDTPITSDITLYAKWGTPVTVTFDSRGGSTVKAIPVAKGKTIKKPDNPTKKDSLFAGWYTDNALTKSFNFNTAITANITLYAKWGTPVTVTFESNGGTVVVAQVIAKGSILKAPAPKKGKLDLLAWYTDSALTQPFNFSMPVTTDTKLYAKYGFRVPDGNFRNKLKALVQAAFTGEVMDVSHTDVTGLSTMDLFRAGIKSLVGIEYFIALTSLKCNNNELTTLDVSKNTQLTHLECHTNKLTALDVSKNTKLTHLECFTNELTALDVSGATALVSLECDANKLMNLDVSSNTVLTSLKCNNNALTALDVSKNTVLGTLFCNNNALTALDLSANTSLASFHCQINQLTILDIRGMTSGLELRIEAGKDGNNPLTILHVLDGLKDNPEIQVVKNNREDAITIITYADDNRTTISCNNYDPNYDPNTKPKGKCLDP